MYILCKLYHVNLKLFAFELAGQERQLSRFPDQIRCLGKLSYEIQTSANGKSARLCFFSGRLKREQLYYMLWMKLPRHTRILIRKRD